MSRTFARNGFRDYRRYLTWLKFLRALRRLPGVFANLRRQSKLLGVIVRSSATLRLWLRQPVLPFKHLSHDYLAASGLAQPARISALTHHYAFLEAHYRGSFLREVFGPGVSVYRGGEGQDSFEVCLSAAGPCYEEGELSLLFKFRRAEIYCLSFTFVPGMAFGSESENVVLISRLQGKAEAYPSIRLAMRMLEGASLAMLLMSILDGIARASRVENWVGVSVANLSPDREKMNRLPYVAYDDFFEAQGAKRGSSHFFHGQFPLVEKELCLVSPRNRARSKMQRKLKAEALSMAYRILQENRKDAAHPCPADAFSLKCRPQT